MFDSNFSRAALSAFGAILFTLTTVGAAVGPARVVETTPVVYANTASDAAQVA